MNASDGRSRVLAALEESLCHDSDIVFAVVFGSLITSDSRTRSDIDVAVKFAEHCSSRERFRKRCFLSGDLQQVDAPFVDCSDIEAAFEERRDDIRRHQRNVIDRIAEDGLHG